MQAGISVKHNADVSMKCLKAILVAKRVSQSYGVDYEGTFERVAKLNSKRDLLLVVVQLDWPLRQLDIKNAFLNRDLEEKVYMEVPRGLHSQGSFGRYANSRNCFMASSNPLVHGLEG